ncbi:STAS-like domain-containing protein [Aerosakkonema funiforme]|uniref:STAS-like domain-containing protein n=1 Tax=Aerosakkonema funiforme FACHB-1375 TaxID=2949571 RepID=A0A926ZJA8_9CYAN|nr:STAS-like domain-containing protein [Aerosakkonema funiforme]MBD2184464.1 STAS-like domain-containing protein [Aerosakkonema funiforme FACHB-1375]
MKFFNSFSVLGDDIVKIVVTEVVGGNLCICCGDGQKVYDRISAAFQAGKKAIVSFLGVKETVPAFMDTAIAQLYEHFTEEEIEAKLSAIDIDADGIDDIKNAVYWKKEYLKDPQRFREAARKSLGDEDE